MRGGSEGLVRLWGCISQRRRADARRIPTNDAPSTKEDNIMNEKKSQMNGKPNEFTRPIREKIAARAHRIWEQEGLPPGREVEHWQRAVRELAAANSRSQERARDAA
jgi:hypothetical protein